VGLVGKLAPRGSRRREFARQQALKFFASMHRVERRVQAEENIAKEEKRLKKAWATHAPEVLDQYLVTGIHNPRINAQSILARHYLIRRLFGDEFEALMKEELAFCAEADEAIRRRAAELGVTIGVYTDPVKRAQVAEVSKVIADSEDRFEKRWREVLAERTAKPLKVLELACGSANDYRFFDSYGLARFLDYTGIDLNQNNIDNARKRFPGVRFEQCSILDLPYDSASFDYVIAFDIFEHLSLQAMERAMAEAVRIAREAFLVGFFIMVDGPAHTERPKGNYHWNELSAPRIRAAMEKHFSSVELIRLKTLIAEQYGYQNYGNGRAWSMFADGRKPAR
jgi:ubiquinone/menaquinone biosynthesis C-methylase UbiE